ncbi:MAG: metalloregulator ArsR/SmtB family transcription factor [Anaerolineae bacterium]|nr:metalloregulator ArsR/SmtB family transcription factor [Anaerolineae bacterium]
MTQRGTEGNLEARAELLKVLGHPVRLLILNLVRVKPRHGEELAAILLLNPATISHHLSKLTQAGLLQSRQDQYYQVYSLAGDVWDTRLSELVFVPQPGLAARVEQDAYRDKVLKTFFRQGRLTQIPAQLKKQLIVLEKMAQEFEPNRAYDEHEVNQILLEFNEDVAALRRGLVSYNLLTREQGIYRRTSAETP